MYENNIKKRMKRDLGLGIVILALIGLGYLIYYLINLL